MLAQLRISIGIATYSPWIAFGFSSALHWIQAGFTLDSLWIICGCSLTYHWSRFGSNLFLFGFTLVSHLIHFDFTLRSLRLTLNWHWIHCGVTSGPVFDSLQTHLGFISERALRLPHIMSWVSGHTHMWNPIHSVVWTCTSIFCSAAPCNRHLAAD